MIRFFNIVEKKSLVAETPLSRFVHNASSGEKKRLYNYAIQSAVKEQKAVLRSFEKEHSREKHIPA